MENLDENWDWKWKTKGSSSSQKSLYFIIPNCYCWTGHVEYGLFDCSCITHHDMMSLLAATTKLSASLASSSSQAPVKESFWAGANSFSLALWRHLVLQALLTRSLFEWNVVMRVNHQVAVVYKNGTPLSSRDWPLWQFVPVFFGHIVGAPANMLIFFN